MPSWDGPENTDFEAIKGGLSDAFKRAGVKWGIGRYLYRLENVWVPCELQGKTIILKSIRGLPNWALPQGGQASLIPHRDAPILQQPASTSPAPDSSHLNMEMLTMTGNPDRPAQPTGNGGKRAVSWNASIVEAIIASGLADNPAGAVKLLNQSELPRETTPDAAVAWAQASSPA